MSKTEAETISETNVGQFVQSLISESGATSVTVTKVSEGIYRIEAETPDP